MHTAFKGAFLGRCVMGVPGVCTEVFVVDRGGQAPLVSEAFDVAEVIYGEGCETVLMHDRKLERDLGSVLAGVC